jgi:hypothetical protein
MRTSRLGFVAVASFLIAALATVGCAGSSSDKGKKKETGTEAVQKFLDQLDKAVRDGDTDFRVARLDPAVIDRYGEQQCRDFLASPQAQDPSRRDKVKRVGKPEPFEFTTDDGAIPVPKAQLVLVQERFQKKKSQRELHVALVDGEYRYFIDCGTPLARQ